MKTLHITNAWHPRSGGIRTFYLALLDAANRHRHYMRLIVPADQSAVEEVGKFGRIYHLSAPPAPFSPSYRILYPHRALLPGGDIHNILREEQPDLVEFCDKFTMNYLGGLLRIGSLPGIPFRPTVVGLSCERLEQTFRSYARPSSYASFVASLYLRWLYFPFADHHIAVSSFVAEELRAVSCGHKVDRGVWIGEMGVNASLFTAARPDPALRSELLTRCGAEPDSRLLVYAGRIAPEKNIGLLFQMMRILEDGPGPGFRLILIGDGDALPALQRQAEDLIPGLAHFIGHRRDPYVLANTLASCDAFVHPNPTEPFGIAPLEAMAAGLPLVAPSQGGVTAYASSENAWLASPTPASFAAAVRDAFASPERRRQRAANARATAISRDWNAATAHFLRLYREIHARVSNQGDFSISPEFFSQRSASR